MDDGSDSFANDDDSSLMQEVDVVSPASPMATSVVIGDDFGESGLTVVVKNPQEMQGDSFLSKYIAYEVHTKTNRPMYGAEDAPVLRRYSDFLWLREQLSYEYKNRLLPPLPPKSDIHRVASDKNDERFIQVRCAALQRFMARLASHPILSCAQCLRLFLVSKPKAFSEAKKVQKTFFSKVNESVSRMAAQVLNRPCDEQVQQLQLCVDKFDSVMGRAEEACDGIEASMLQLQQSYKDMATCICAFAETDEGLHNIMMDLQAIMKHYADGYNTLLNTMSPYLTEPIRDYHRYAESFKSVIISNKSLQVDAAALSGLLEAERKKLNDVNRANSKSSVENQAKKKKDIEHQIATLSSQAEQARDNVEVSKGDLIADLDRFNNEQQTDFQNMFLAYADANIGFLESARDKWSDLILQMEES